MRVAVVGLSAVLLSGCSWLGGAYGGGAVPHAGYGAEYGAEYGAGYGAEYAAPGVACAPQAGYQTGYAQAYNPACGQGGFAQQNYAEQGYAATGAYGAEQYAGYGQGQVAGGAYGAGGLSGYGQTAGVGYQGAYGVPGQVGQQVGVQQGYGAFGNGSVQTLQGGPVYGGVYGQNVVGSQYAGGQFVGGAVQTVQGAPIYVPEPYAVPVGVGVGGGVAAAALPFGLALLGGTDFDVSGDIYTEGKNGPAKDANGNDVPGNTVGDSNGISFSDAFDPAKRIGVALERDLGPSTTLLGQVAYSQANGNVVRNYESVDILGGGPRFLDAEFGDLETYTAEVGVRQYIGKPTGLRPYIGATAGAVYNEAVSINRTYSDNGQAYDAAPIEEFIDSGWSPTAAGLIGAELPVGHRGAIGVESGIRWTDGYDTIFGETDNRLTVPVTLRGRVAF